MKNNTTDLTHVRAASAVKRHIATNPTTPVVLHWQLPGFPARVAKALLESHGCILWVVATAERAAIAEKSLEDAGMAVHRFQNPQAEATPCPKGPSTNMAQVRARLKEKARKTAAAAAAQYPAPKCGSIAVVSIHRLLHTRPLSEISEWPSLLVVFDHVGSLNARWLEIEDDSDDSRITYKNTRLEGSHPVPVFQDADIPTVFICRDEYECALFQSDFTSRQRPSVRLATTFSVPARVVRSVVATDLVTAKYAAGAFLSIEVCTPQADVVGEAIIGAVTPDWLSMSTTASLKKVALKLSHQHRGFQTVAQKQTGLSTTALAAMRTRDFLRTAVLAIDPSARTPELVALCPYDKAIDISTFLGAVSTTTVPKWHRRASIKHLRHSTSFAEDVTKAAYCFPVELDHGARLAAIGRAFEREKRENRPFKLAKLAMALQRSVPSRQRVDLAGRPELFAGTSEHVDRAMGTFNKVLDLVFPWSPCKPSSQVENLRMRVATMHRYSKSMRAAEEKKNKVVTNDARRAAGNISCGDAADAN